jgi:hypothetical protein
MIVCKQCQSDIPKNKSKNVFCCKSCATTYNNYRKPPRSAESKNKTSLTLKHKIELGILPVPAPPIRPTMRHTYTKLFGRYTCHHCQKDFWQTKSNQKCCSIECRDSIRSQNKCLKNQLAYYNKFEDKTVILQSKWELIIAEWLTSNEIEWIRPITRLKWNDTSLDKSRTYLPDFYLTKYQIYLDVKNPIKQKEDADKLQQLKMLLTLEVGDIDYIKNYVARLIGLEPTCIH